MRSTSPPREPVRGGGVPFVQAAALVIVATFLPSLVSDLDPVATMRVAVISSVGAVLMVVRAAKVGMGAGPSVLLLFWVFHYGLIVFWAMGLTPPLASALTSEWAGPEQVASASVPVTVFCLLLAAAYLATVGIRRSVDTDPRECDRDPAVPRESPVGPLLVLGGVALWTLIWRGSGVGITGQYVTFLEATAGSATPYCYLFLSLGGAMTGASRRWGWLSRLAIGAYGIWMVPAFLLGLRGEVLIPILAFLVAASRSGTVRVTWRRGMAAAVVALAAGSFVRVFRVGLSGGWEELNPLNGLAEVGHTIKPMVLVQQLHDTASESFVGLITYLGPLERFVSGRLLGRATTDITQDQAVFSTFISTNYGQIGGSVAAEAFRSSGMLGIVLVALVLGALLGRLDTTPSDTGRDAAVAAVTAVLLLWVRNDFTPVPVSLLITAIALMASRMVSREREPKVSGRRTGTLGHASLRAGSFQRVVAVHDVLGDRAQPQSKSSAVQAPEADQREDRRSGDRKRSSRRWD